MADVTTPWLDSYPPGVPEHVEVPSTNLARLLADAARDFSNAPAVHFEGRTVSYAQLADQAWRFAGALAGLGVTKGTRVGLVLPNCPQAVIAFFGALRLGAVVVQNNPLYTERELGHQLSDAEVEVVVCLDLVYERVKSVRAQAPSIREVVVTSLLDELPAVKRALAPYTKKGKAASTAIGRDEPVRRWRDLLSGSQTKPSEAEVDPATDLALLQYTGGTTGLSKGVMLSHGNLRANVEQVRAWFPDADPGREVMMAVLPFFHVYGLTVCLLLAVRIGAALVLLPRFDLDHVLAAVDKYRPSLFPGVPTMYVAINNAVAKGGHDLSSIKACLSGAAPLPLEVAERFERYSGGRLVEGYGLSESSPVALANPVYGKRKAGTVGMPLPDTEARVVDPSDPSRALPTGESGELAIRGPQVMRGYWNRPDDSAQVLQGGWLLTGDMAVMDDEGYFSIVDRKKDLIIAGGYNVYPREVEEVLYEHPKVAEACVAGVPDPYRGETVKAWVVLREGEQATPDDIRAFAKDRLAAYKVPRTVELRDELPKTLIGKVLRRALVEEERARAAAEEETQPETQEETQPSPAAPEAELGKAGGQ
ncbi:MAG TPA: long-chain fatty acid--CoA ligase [Actinomycetes bacterium]|jgi:long-chain acyl-CoA synthetase|nr:long-chain fatty acid--CoA ligase [Actinomycetes bacterium]